MLLLAHTLWHFYLKPLTEDPIELLLFCSRRQSALLYNKFDQAMMAFLDGMQEFKEEAKKGEKRPDRRFWSEW